jgi:hypothetical protein
MFPKALYKKENLCYNKMNTNVQADNENTLSIEVQYEDNENIRLCGISG